MGEEPAQELMEFASSEGVATKWEAARLLMTNRQLQAHAHSPEFRAGFTKLGLLASTATGLERLLAIALIVRISDFLKGQTKQEGSEFLKKALGVPPDYAWQISDKRNLTVDAKPAEVRENIALALEHATGDWVLGYAYESLVREDRSQRCRLELCRQIAKRDDDVAQWIGCLANYAWASLGLNTNDAAVRTRDIAEAFTSVLKANRAKSRVSENAGPLLAKWADRAIQLSSRSGTPNKLESSAIALLALLDEILVTELSLIDDAETYAILGAIYRWWQPLSYPPELTSALDGIVRKLTSAIKLLARRGARSESLVSRLQQALGPNRQVRQALVSIAESENGLADDIDDWLRGQVRQATTTSHLLTSLLSGQESNETATVIAPLLLEILTGREFSFGDDARDVPAWAQRINTLAEAAALNLGIGFVGSVGERVRFNANEHQTVDGSTPPEPTVTILRPMIIRKRNDGSVGVLERAIVGT